MWWADQRHVDNVRELLDLKADSKPLDSPGTNTTGATVDKTLTNDDLRTLVPKVGGVLIYLSQDVPQIQFAAKCIMSDAQHPTLLTEARLKRAGRYLIGHPVTEWHYPVQDLPQFVLVEGDADWAGAEDAKSTQCTVMMFGDHCLEVTTSGQNYVATASAISDCF